MSLDTSGRSQAPPNLPIQFVDIEITPLLDGRFGLVMGATFLDEQDLEFVGQELANTRVETLDQALVVIRENVAVLSRAL